MGEVIIMNLFFIVGLSIPIICGATGFPRYSPDSLVFKIDKSKDYYTIDPITPKEKTYSKEFREIQLRGTIFPDSAKVIILPKQIPKPKSPYEAIGNFLFAIKNKDLEKILALHDSSSRGRVDSIIHDPIKSPGYFSLNNSGTSLQVKAIFENPELLIVFEKYLKGNVPSLRPMFFINERGIYKKKTGDLKISYLVNLWSALQIADSSAIIKK